MSSGTTPRLLPRLSAMSSPPQLSLRTRKMSRPRLRLARRATLLRSRHWTTTTSRRRMSPSPTMSLPPHLLPRQHARCPTPPRMPLLCPTLAPRCRPPLSRRLPTLSTLLYRSRTITNSRLRPLVDPARSLVVRLLPQPRLRQMRTTFLSLCPAPQPSRPLLRRASLSPSPRPLPRLPQRVPTRARGLCRHSTPHLLPRHRLRSRSRSRSSTLATAVLRRPQRLELAVLQRLPLRSRTARPRTTTAHRLLTKTRPVAPALQLVWPSSVVSSLACPRPSSSGIPRA